MLPIRLPVAPHFPTVACHPDVPDEKSVSRGAAGETPGEHESTVEGAVVAGAVVAPPVAGVPPTAAVVPPLAVAPPPAVVCGVPVVPPVPGRSPPEDPPQPAADAAKTRMLETVKVRRKFTAILSMSCLLSFALACQRHTPNSVYCFTL